MIIRVLAENLERCHEIRGKHDPDNYFAIYC